MNKNKLVILLAAMSTLILGPGAGHLILKKWKKSIFFISLAIALFAILAINFISDIGRDTLMTVLNFQQTQNLQQFKEIYAKFRELNPKTILFFDILFSALWAYSIVDIFIPAGNKDSGAKEEDNEN